MKKIIEDLNVFRKYISVRQELVMKYKQVFLLLKMSFKPPLKIIYLVKNRGKSFWLDGDKQKTFSL